MVATVFSVRLDSGQKQASQVTGRSRLSLLEPIHYVGGYKLRYQEETGKLRITKFPLLLRIEETFNQ
jgi:hypothetical protein